MPKVKVNDIEIYYEIISDGFPLLMIQGLTANKDWWDDKLLEELSKQYKLIIFDNRGAGRTDKPDMLYSIKLFAEDAFGLLKALNIEKAHILGISMGGMIAQELAINHPEIVEKLILAATTPGGAKSVLPSDQLVEQLRNPPIDVRPEIWVQIMLSLTYTSNFRRKNKDYIKDISKKMMIAPTPPETFKRQVRATMTHNTARRLKSMNIPTLLLHGKKDLMLPWENSNVMHSLIPNSEVVLYENCGHHVFSHEPEVVIKKILEFLSK